MTRPTEVIGFLDFFGRWDASLAFVMLGAICGYFIANRWSRKLASPLFAAKFSMPTRADLDADLIAEAAIFGAGWGLAGICPGPAIVSLASGAMPAAVFVISMACGIYLHSWSSKVRQSESRAAAHLLGVSADA